MRARKRISRSGVRVSDRLRARAVALATLDDRTDTLIAEAIGAHHETIATWRRESRWWGPAVALVTQLNGQLKSREDIETAVTRMLKDPDLRGREPTAGERLHQLLDQVDVALARASAAAQKQGGFVTDPEELLAWLLKKRDLGTEPDSSEAATRYWDCARAETIGLALELESYEPIGDSARDRNPTYHPLPEDWERGRRADERRLPFAAPLFPEESEYVFQLPRGIREVLTDEPKQEKRDGSDNENGQESGPARSRFVRRDQARDGVSRISGAPAEHAAGSGAADSGGAGQPAVAE